MSDGPNLIVVMTDQQRADMCAADGFGLDTTPAIDALGRDGVRCTRAFTPMPVCLPARCSALTGRYPSAHGMRTNGLPLAPAYDRDLVDVLDGAGYTAALSGKDHTYRQVAALAACTPPATPCHEHIWDRILRQTVHVDPAADATGGASPPAPTGNVAATTAPATPARSPDRMNDAFHTEFTYRAAIAYEPGVTRRDPSPVIEVDGTYHVWYSKATVDASGYFASVWHATSPDGLAWTEVDEAIPTGGDDAWDGNGCFTPTILVAGGRYYLFYTAVPKPFDNDKGGPKGTPTAIGVAEADAPDGPWRRFAGNPVLRPGTEPGAPDGHRLDDACFVVRDGRYWLYYKGRGAGLTPGQTVMCLAIADAPTGPYVKSGLNPIIDSGHEVCVWPHGDGVAAMTMPTGPHGRTVQYSGDGVHFEIRAQVEPPSAPGPFRADHYRQGWGPGITWGLCQDTRSADRPFLLRFDGDLRARRDG